MYEYRAKIVGVYDGDSVTALVDLGFKINFTIKIRLRGINTPEIRGVERPEGLIAKARVVDLILNKDVILKTHKDRTGKYGRYLGEVFLKEGDISINQILLNEGLAKPYLK